ncbi:hypothetical protein QJS10_CPB17g00813 [Acorus calamus]|uniref:Protein kinase domain-containing protein n=1 Tax=Acorus calamus TaxID=4465 RepID=A0AAV9CUI7_ACOCL|nr:hypothetical protein QJS10_CPB17g00813 [Acorus calamus]
MVNVERRGNILVDSYGAIKLGDFDVSAYLFYSDFPHDNAKCTTSSPHKREKKFWKSFRAMISTCLVKNRQARPSAERLLRHFVFKKARSQDYIVRTILEGLSTLGDHLKELKLKEDDMIEQQKIPDGKKEEMSQGNRILCFSACPVNPAHPSGDYPTKTEHSTKNKN